MRDPSPERVAKLHEYWGADANRAIPIRGDLTKPGLGIAERDFSALRNRVDHFFHLAAVYDLDADPEIEMATNIGGTQEAVRVAEAIGAKRFHHMSSIAAAGLYDGVFREDMFEEAEQLDHPYFASKHAAEKIVRIECKLPWRIYRPGLVVGDSRTGEMDKIDGPYYFFKLIQKIRQTLPPWVPVIGIEGGRLNLVPVDFVVAAMDHLAHLEGQDGNCFHLTDPNPERVGDVLNIFARAAHASEFSARINGALFNLIPVSFIASLMALKPVRRIHRQIFKDLGLPNDILRFINYPTRFDCRQAGLLLNDAGITVPRLPDYAWRLWDYWERHLDPDLFLDRSLRGAVDGRVVVITGGSSGIGKATAFRVAEAGAITIIVARDMEKLEATRQEAKRRGLSIIAFSADISDPAGCAAVATKINAEYGGVDILINNAGRSIRRSIENTFDRLHDFDRMMRINYFGSINLTMGLLPNMMRRKRGHVITISSIGVLTNSPHFSAYVASKAALEAWMRCAASEFLDRDIAFTIINMPLVRTSMVAPTKLYEHVAMLTPERAAELVVEAIIHSPARIATRLGLLGQAVNIASPRIGQIIMNTAFRMFPDSGPAHGDNSGANALTADQAAFIQLLRGFHL